jgi:hypothetical protein
MNQAISAPPAPAAFDLGQRRVDLLAGQFPRLPLGKSADHETLIKLLGALVVA